MLLLSSLSVVTFYHSHDFAELFMLEVFVF